MQLYKTKYSHGFQSLTAVRDNPSLTELPTGHYLEFPLEQTPVITCD